MIINILLLFLVLGALGKKKLKPHSAGLIIGGVKAIIHLFFSRSILNALVIGVIFGLLGAALIYLLQRIRKKPVTPIDPSKMYSRSADKSKFHLEYIPITGITLVMLGGESVFLLLAMNAE